MGAWHRTSSYHENPVVVLEWPALVAWFWTAVPLATAVGILAQRHALTHPGRATVYVAIAALPWLIQLVGVFPPRPLFFVLVLGGTTGLLLHPVEIDIAPFLMVFMVAEMGAMASVREGAIYTGASIALMVGFNVAGRFTQSYPWLIGFVLTWGGGAMVRAQVELLGKLRAAQDALATQAATDERRRIARELHDVIAHSLTVMMLHVTGARRALDRDTHDAAAALEQAERLGRQSLQDVRRVVGVLGTTDGSEPTPMPGAPDITALVDQFRNAGATITIDITGELGTLEPTAGLALYRIVQESLTNAAKHAPGTAVDVVIEATTDGTRLRVTNALTEAPAPKARSNGLGLWGMKERATLLGGDVSARANGARWVVEAVVPSARPSP